MAKNLGQAILRCSCPKCRQGKMFEPMPLSKWFGQEMHSNCPNCGHTLEPEPGFYYGAMFVSYGFSVAITFVTIVVLYNFFGDPHLWVYSVAVSLAVILMWPLMYRYSRSIFLHLFGGIRFDAKYSSSE